MKVSFIPVFWLFSVHIIVLKLYFEALELCNLEKLKGSDVKQLVMVKLYLRFRFSNSVFGISVSIGDLNLK